jgi:cation transport ATPase
VVAFDKTGTLTEGQAVARGWSGRMAGQRRLLGLLAFGDTVKPAAAEAVVAAASTGHPTVMLTGDNRGAPKPSRRNWASPRCVPRCCPVTRRPS